MTGNFFINQRAVSGSVVLAAGIYGHDRFKAGSGGCSYTFATLNGVTTITISAGTLEQVIEAENIEAGDYILSWTGTAQGQIDGGGFGDSGLVTDTLDGSANVTVEFDTGTLSLPQLELGTDVTAYERRPIGEELNLCHRYYERWDFITNRVLTTAQAISSSGVNGGIHFKEKRAIPTVGNGGNFDARNSVYNSAGGSISFASATTTHSRLSITGASGLSAGDASGIFTNATTYVDFDAEL